MDIGAPKVEYQEIELDDLRIGQAGLRLFSSDGVLAGCMIERQADGSLLNSHVARCDSSDFITQISAMFARIEDDTFRVIIDQGGYWPNEFPAIKRIVRAQARASH